MIQNDDNNDNNVEMTADENHNKVADFCRLLLLNLAKEELYALSPDRKMLFRKDMGALNILYIREINLDVAEIVKEYFTQFAESAGFKGSFQSPFYRFINVAEDYEEIRPVFESIFRQVEKQLYDARIMCEIDIVDLKTGKIFSVSGGKIHEKKLLKVINDTLNSEKPADEQAQAAAEAIRKNAEEFKKAMNVRKFNPWFNISNILIAINVIIFIADIFLRRVGNNAVLNFGIQNNQLVKEGQWWRLFTSMFLHADVTHLVGNMFTLWIVGKIILKYYNSMEFLLIYLFGGLFGNVLGLFFLPAEALSLGASGAIMALGGVIIYRSFFGKYRKYFRKTGNYLAIALVILYNLFYGLFQPEVDNYGHFGGFIIGFLMALIIAFTKNKKREDKKNDL